MSAVSAVSVACPAGTIVGERDGDVVRFFGIPYAEAPTGALRFEDARPRASFSQPFAADAWGATPQRGRPYASTVIPEPSIDGEDTLNLNIVAPASEAAHEVGSWPVLVWIHGGGYVSGSPASTWYDGSDLARRGIVFVSISYRLGFEGFGTVDGRANRAVSDWLCALRWVRENIRSFGGDPGSVTIAGQSAGAGAVLTLLAMPSAQGLFERAVALSPTDQSIAPEAAEAIAAEYLSLLDTARPGLETVSSLHLQEASVQLADDRLSDGTLAFAPVHGTAVLPHPIAAGLARCGLDKPLLIGTTKDEFDRPAASPAHPSISDVLFRAACRRAVAARSSDPASGTWLYRFDWRSPLSGTAGHCIDVPFFLGTTSAATDVLGPEPPVDLATVMSGDLCDFVRGATPAWPAARGKDADVVRTYGSAADRPVVDRAGVDPAPTTPRTRPAGQPFIASSTTLEDITP